MEDGFKNLYIENDVHIGTNCLFDLNNKILIGQGTTISPKVTIITHSDAGSYHQSPICQAFQTTSEKVVIEPYCWIGVGSTILSGVTIRKHSVIGACSLVNNSTEEMGLYYGIPAKFQRHLKITK
jgi:acetyltransferase-like isoleucine patch superfamily enzyme